MAFNLSFAGVPLCLDGAFSFCIQNSKDSNPVIPDRLKGILKHEPEIDLMDEIERVAPFLYAEEFSYEDNYTGRNLGAIAHPWNVTPMKTLVRLGDFYYPTTAGKWSVFRGLVGTAQRDAILNVTQGNTSQELLLYSDINIGTNTNVSSNARISTSMFMLPPRPLTNFSSQFGQLHVITLVDDRYYMQNTGITFKKADLATWDTLIASFALQAGITVNYSTISAAYGYPEGDSPLWTNGESTATLFDAIAYNIGRVVVRNLDGSYSLLTPVESQAIVQANVLNVPTTQGGEILYSGSLSRNSVIPSSITVTFPKYVTGDDPVPHFLNSRTQNQPQSLWYQESYGEVHSVTIPITSGGIYASGLSGTSTSTIHSTAKALISGENQSIPFNVSGLTSLATQIAGDIYATSIIGIDQSFDGIWNFTPDGLHDLVWTYSQKSRGVYTRIVKNNWNINIWERQHSLAISGQTNYLKGIGGPIPALNVKDNVSGTVNTFAITNALTSGGLNVTIPSVDGLPTQNRWKGKIENESIFFEGSSGGIYSGGLFNLNIVYRGIDGTIQTAHNSGVSLTKTNPNVTYGTNLISFEKGQFVFPNRWTSGGIQEINVLPQIQSVKALSSTSTNISGLILYSGQVLGFDPIQLSGQQFYNLEYVWLRENNNQTITSGNIYDGHLIGFSPTPTAQGGAGPIYSITQGGAGSTGVYGQANDSPVPGYGPYATVDIANASPTIGNNLSVVVSGDSLNSRNRWVIDNLGEYVRANSGTSFLRRRINFVNGSGTIPVVSDFSGSDEVQVQINTSGLVNDLCSGTGGAATVTVYPTTRQTFDKNAGFLLTDLTNGRDFISMDYSSGSPLFASGSNTFITNLYNAYTNNGALVDWNFYKIVSTTQYHPAGPPLMFTATALSTTALPEGYIFAVPFMETRGGTIDRLAARLVQTATNSGSTLRFGVYAAASPTTLYPGALVVDGGTIDVTSGANTKIEVTVNTTIPRGLNFLVVRTTTNYGLFGPAIQTITGQTFVYNWSLFGVIGTSGLDVGVAAAWPTAWFVSGLGADAALPATFPVSGLLATALDALAFPVLFRRYSA